MARNDPTAMALDRLAALRHAPDSPEKLKEIRAALRHKSNFVVARAAKLAGELRLKEVTPDLGSAFERLFPHAPKLDKGCAALTEIVSALYDLDYTEPDIFLRAIHHIQMEASFGPPVDVAAKLRGTAALGLGRTRHPHAMAEIVNVLVDKEPPARQGAVRAVATNGGETGALLLRLKTLAGDDDPEVLVECFTGLLAQNSADSISFVERFVDSPDDSVAESAIIALGASRLPGALQVLRRKWERTAHSPIRKPLLAAIASNRSDEAAEFLLSLLRTESVRTAADVLTALVGYRSNERINAAAAKVVADRNEQSLNDLYHSEY